MRPLLGLFMCLPQWYGTFPECAFVQHLPFTQQPFLWCWSKLAGAILKDHTLSWGVHYYIPCDPASGVSGNMFYLMHTEQLSWLFFLKCIHTIDYMSFQVEIGQLEDKVPMPKFPRWLQQIIYNRNSLTQSGLWINLTNWSCFIRFSHWLIVETGWSNMM